MKLQAASQRQSLAELETDTEFVARHNGPRDAEIASMLKAVNAPSLAAFVDSVVPANIRTEKPLALPAARSERETLAYLKGLASQNQVLTSMIGMGYYGTITPPVILRNVLENPGWYTAYTPYQAEISQGRLEAILNYQQMVVDLTGLPLANASLLDEATAAAEAMATAKRVTDANRSTQANAFFVDQDTHPQTIGVLKTRAAGFGFQLIVGDPAQDLDPKAVFGALLSYPGSSGAVRDWRSTAQALHKAGALVVVATDLLALALLTPPGEFGADIAIGSAQRFGVPMGYGGPHAAFFATRDEHKRVIPGRLIGVSVDARGQRALRMALQTREQHIRREKATSNICTAQVLLAVTAAMYAVYHGPDGIRRIAERTHRFAQVFAAGVASAAHQVVHAEFFDTVTVRTNGKAAGFVAKALEAGINLRLVDAGTLSAAFDETTTRQDLAKLLTVFGVTATVEALDARTLEVLSSSARRTSPFLTHPVFAQYHSETEMLRYLRHLQAKDIALDRGMIPLGSCTMKLNATSEMIPVTWPEFGQLHPFAPADQAKGYAKMFRELEAWLSEITGFAACSLQPNAGSQGEYAGLLAIRAYHDARGDTHRSVCLIPTSAHGTNPASAAMAGMRIVAVACDAEGNVDIPDLKAKATQHAANLAALMVTYPSTHGVFEAGIKEICSIVHAAGGQVYMDGANMNAQVGLTRPGELGADVCHLNLHKTFCIPHGGGGPGMGPICVAQHLAPYLSGHAVVASVDGNGLATGGQVSAAPWGSASILPISWAYIAMMGGEGLTQATGLAILGANYIAARLKPHYPVLYTGANDRVAHECIIDLRWLKERTGLTAEDVAKRLMDYGFHAPTLSFPVAETLMIEPTESESKRELDRFCDALIAIRREIAEVEDGRADRTVNVLKNAPHVPALLFSEWTLPYSREKAFHPLPIAAGWRDDKYWPPVSRVDGVYGDRNIICTCPPIEAFAEAAE